MLDMNRVYYNAFINRCYLNYVKTDELFQACDRIFKKLKDIWSDRDVVILESKDAPMGVTNDLLNTTKSVSRIVFCPVRNAFERYDDIVSSFNDISKDNLILISLGPTATVLAYDLCMKGYQAIDIGFIAAEYESFLNKETPFELRDKGHDVVPGHKPDPDNPKYKKQIIKVIS